MMHEQSRLAANAVSQPFLARIEEVPRRRHTTEAAETLDWTEVVSWDEICH